MDAIYRERRLSQPGAGKRSHGPRRRGQHRRGRVQFRDRLAGAGDHPGSFVWPSALSEAPCYNDTFTARAPDAFLLSRRGDGYSQLRRSQQPATPGGSATGSNKTDVTTGKGRTDVLRASPTCRSKPGANSSPTRLRHISPIAQDFSAAFGVGEDDTHINTVDADGVALAAIQGLYHLVQQKDATARRARGAARGVGGKARIGQRPPSDRGTSCPDVERGGSAMTSSIRQFHRRSRTRWRAASSLRPRLRAVSASPPPAPPSSPSSPSRSANSVPGSIVFFNEDGKLWFVERGAQKIGRMSPNGGAVDEFGLVDRDPFAHHRLGLGLRPVVYRNE